MMMPVSAPRTTRNVPTTPAKQNASVSIAGGNRGNRISAFAVGRTTQFKSSGSKLAHQPRFFCTQKSSGSDIINLITQDHQNVRNLIQSFDKTSELEKKQQLAYQVIRELSMHSAAEELVLYPAFDKYMNNGREMHEHSLQEHQLVKENLYNLDSMKIEDPNFVTVFKKAMALLDHHIQQEENEFLPKLKAAVDTKTLTELGSTFLDAKKLAPTRPHPSAPKEGIAAAAANVVAGQVDRLRDSLESRPRQ